MPPANLLSPLPFTLPEEEFSEILSRPDLRIERIVSTGQSSPPDYWYDQPWDEWVLVLAGAARLRIEGEVQDRALAPGDHLLLPAHTRHRVAWTAPDAPTVWLAVHCPPKT
ncbi:MAG: cupin domain-containing protein [Methylobacterium frigidaeris]